MNTLLDSPKYKKFTQDRNKALEQINLNSQLDTSRILFTALDNITNYVSRMALGRDMNIYMVNSLKDSLAGYVGSQFATIVPQIVDRMKRTRKATFILSYLGELEAIARATGQTKPISQAQFKMQIQNAMGDTTVTGKQLEHSIWLSFLKLENEITMAFVRAILNDLSPLEVVQAVKDAYPEVKTYKRPPRAVKPLREADDGSGKEFDFYFGLTNDEDWDLAVQAYKDTELPVTRFDQQASTYDPEAGYFQYGWEQEQNATDDFVQAVRAGQVAAAEQMGVKEFVWVAIIDNKTCEVCCLPRNGKTTSEIEEMLASGKLDASHCDARVPPAHPNCRCDTGPVASVDEVEGANWKDFGEWLDS